MVVRVGTLSPRSMKPTKSALRLARSAEEALGADMAAALPELLRLTDLEVRIPRMEVVALEHLAARERQSVSAVLARELRDLVSVHAQWLSMEVSGFAEALAWPEVG
jgi:hypothetical protein